MNAHTYPYIAVLLSLQYRANEAVEMRELGLLAVVTGRLLQPFDPNVVTRLQHRPRVIHRNLCIGHVQVDS